MPKELKYRYPAPGSTPIDKQNYQHMFKPHWKQSWRVSAYNVRLQEKKPENEDEHGIFVDLPTYSESDPLDEKVLLEQQHRELPFENLKIDHQSEEEQREELWAAFESVPGEQ